MIPLLANFNTVMLPVRYTRNLFLRGMCLIYLSAFLSFYVQIPGLYGDNGILPVRTQVVINKDTDLATRIHNKPTLLWFAPYVGLDTEYMMDVLAILGCVLSFTGLVLQKFALAPVFFALWSLYFSLYQVGQTFMWFQWDTLLLEAGLLTILIAPWRYQRHRFTTSTPSEALSLWPVRWLLFRVLFTNGFVKLDGDSPLWWGLKALSVHFQSMPLPAPLAWYAHHLPAWYLKVNTAVAIAMDLTVPWMFFAPMRIARLTAAILQIILQVHIILTGNFNFYNFLVIVLCLSLFDDGCFIRVRQPQTSPLVKLLTRLPGHAVQVVFLYAFINVYGLKFLSDYTLDANIMFTPEQFQMAVTKAIPYSTILGLLSFSYVAIRSILMSLFNYNGFNRVKALGTTLIFALGILFIFSLTTVPHAALHSSSNATVIPEVRKLHTKFAHLHVANSYPIYGTLYGNIPGAKGRLEICIEGSNNVDGPWTEYQFMYKPGNVNTSLPLIAPYQPRLDWQMYFAAQGTYHQNPWLMSLAYRLLEGRPEVLRLLGGNPFPNKPPKYVRAILYNYKYSKPSNRQNSWWEREEISEYFPVFSRDHPPLLEYLRKLKIIDVPKPSVLSVYPPFKLVLDHIRDVTSTVDGSMLIWTVFLTATVIVGTRRRG